jgi:hypothetical protein
MTEPTFKSRFIYHLPDYWTPEQVLAVVEFIGDLREAIWAHYGEQLTEIYRQQHLCEPSSATPPDDRSF